MNGRVPYGQRPCPIRPTPPSPTLFDELADLYELDGAVVHRVLAYRNAAKAVREAPRSVAAMTREGTVTELPGIGKTLEEKIEALLETGTIPAVEKLRARSSRPGLDRPHAAARARAQARPQALRRARHRLAGERCARPPRARSCATCAASAPSSRSPCSRPSRPASARRPSRGCCSHGAGDRRGDRRRAARAACASDRGRAGRLRTAPGRRRQGPRHHRHGLRSAGAHGRLRRARRDRERGFAGRERRARRAPTRASPSTCAWSSPTSSATCCSTSPAPRRTTWRCARRPSAAGCTSPSTACSTTPPARRTAARPRRRSTSCSGCRGSRPSCARTAASWR